MVILGNQFRLFTFMRYYVIASVLIILGLVSIAYSGTLADSDWRSPYLGEFSSALLVGGLLSVLFKIFQDRESEITLRRLFRIHDSIEEVGLVEVLREAQAYNFTDIIEDSDNLSIVMNDGLRWIGNNTVNLQNRFSKQTVTNFYLVDPDSPFVTSLASKMGLTTEELQRKIRDSWKRLYDCYERSNPKGVLRIYRLKTYPTRSIFLSETIYVETPYQTASGRVNVPVFVYKKVDMNTCMFSFAQKDVAFIQKEAILEKEYSPQHQPALVVTDRSKEEMSSAEHRVEPTRG